MPDEESSPSLSRRQLAANIAVAYVRRNQLAVSDIALLISTIRQTLARLGTLGIAPEATSERTPAVSVRRSVHREYVVCLECGWKGKTLGRHLTTSHALSPTAYRARWDLPPDHRLIAAAYSERRSAIAKRLGLGRGGRGSVPVAAPATPSPSEGVNPAFVASLPIPKKRGRPRAAPKP